MKESGPVLDSPTMEGYEVESKSRGSDPADHSENSLFNTQEEEEDQVSRNDKDDAENYRHAHDAVQPDSEVVKTVTDIQADEKEMKAQTCSQDQEEHELRVISDDASFIGGEKPLSNQTDEALETPVDDVVESSPSVPKGTLQTFDEVKDSHAIHLNRDEHSLELLTDCSATLPPPAEDNASAVCPSSSVQCGLKHSPTDSTTTSGISNGPSTPSSDIVGSSPTSSPQTSVNTLVPSESLSSPYDTDCSRKLISEIQRSLSQESLLDELESELLACQLPKGEKSPAANGLTDQEGCMVVFEKCVQYKYAQQEKAVQR